MQYDPSDALTHPNPATICISETAWAAVWPLVSPAKMPFEPQGVTTLDWKLEIAVVHPLPHNEFKVLGRAVMTDWIFVISAAAMLFPKQEVITAGPYWFNGV